MLASDLSGRIWSAIADLVERSQSPREIYFVKVKKADAKKLLIWAEDFGDLAIPLVGFLTAFSYFDTVPDNANLSTGVVSSHMVKRQDSTRTNTAYNTQIVCPKVGQIAVVLDPSGAKRFPFCVGVIQSRADFWEGE